MEKIVVKEKDVEILTKGKTEYISLTSIAKYKNDKRPNDIIKNWIRNRNTIEYLGLWERINNPNFKPVEFDGFKQQAGLNTFVLTTKQWIEGVNARGIIQNPVNMEEHTLIKTLHLNSHLGYPLSLNCI